VSRATFAIALSFLVAASARGDPWQLDKVPALIPGATGTWDSDSIADASVVRFPQGWTLFYEGSSLDEAGAGSLDLRQRERRRRIGVIALFRQAADAENPEAMRNLAKAYREGVGVAADSTEAEKWQKKADDSTNQ
jgi:hypothetical protein